MLGYGLSEDEAARLHQPAGVLGFGVKGLGSRDLGSGFGVNGAGFRDLGFGVYEFGVCSFSLFGKLDALSGPQSVPGSTEARMQKGFRKLALDCACGFKFRVVSWFWYCGTGEDKKWNCFFRRVGVGGLCDQNFFPKVDRWLRTQ